MSKTINQDCPICKNREAKILGERYGVNIIECKNCGFAFVDRAVWENPYKNIDYYDSAKQPIINYPLTPSQTDFDRLSSIPVKYRAGKLLEIGGGLGRTAIAAQQLGYEVTIIEESKLAVQNGQKYHPEIRWIEASEIPSTLEDETFDVVTMFHVLEHIPEPDVLIQQITRILKKGGLFLIEVPNWGSNTRRLKGLNWCYVLDHHVNYFSAKTLTNLLEKMGFKNCSIEFRRTFAVNERQAWKKPIKKLLCFFGFAEVLRGGFVKTTD